MNRSKPFGEITVHRIGESSAIIAISDRDAIKIENAKKQEEYFVELDVKIGKDVSRTIVFNCSHIIAYGDKSELVKYDTDVFDTLSSKINFEREFIPYGFNSKDKTAFIKPNGIIPMMEVSRLKVVVLHLADRMYSTSSLMIVKDYFNKYV